MEDKNELKAKYARIASDPSQIEMFKNDFIDGKISSLPTPPEEGKATLTYAHGLVQWVKEGEEPAYPVPEEPEIAPDNPSLLLLGQHDDVDENVIVMPSTEVVGNAIIL